MSHQRDRLFVGEVKTICPTCSYYDGGHWGAFPAFQKSVEDQVMQAQKDWKKPAATIRFFRDKRVVETIEQVSTTRRLYRERRV